MTISVSASDIQYGVTKANGREYAFSRGSSDIWSTKNPAVTAGKNCVTMHNQFSQFPNLNLVMITPDPNSGTFSGIVTEELVPVARVVRLYRRSDGQFVKATTSSATDGSFSFTAIPAGVEHFVVFHDDESVAPNFNAKIFDQVVPV